MTKIHSTAIVHSGAEIDSDVEIGAYCVIGPNVKIAKGTKLHSHVVIDGYTSLGEHNEVFPFACLGTAPQDLKFGGEASTLEIGNSNKIRESVTMQPGTVTGHMRTVVGSGNLFMANCHVAHDCVVGDHNVLANSVALAGHVELQNHVILGGMAGIHQFSRIGTMAFIGAGAMVSQDVPPFCIAQGDRAVVKGLNLVGLRRANLKQEELVGIKKTYRHFFSSLGHMKEKVESFPTELTSVDKAMMILNFIKESKRGIVSPSRHVSSETEE